MIRNLKTWIILGGVAAALTASTANAQSRGGGGVRPGGGSWGGGHHGGGWGGGHHHGSNWGVSVGYGGFGGYYGYGGYRPYYYGGYYGYPRVGVVYSAPYYGVAYTSNYVQPVYTQPIYSQAVISQTAVADPTPIVVKSPAPSISNYPLTTNKVRLRVNMPSPDARLSINGQATQQLGTDRLFDSPAMEAGKVYVYQLQATWMENGREVTRTKSIDVQVGNEYSVDFKADAEAAPAPLPK